MSNIFTGYLNDTENIKTDELMKKKSYCLDCALDNTLICDTRMNNQFIVFIHEVLKSSILKMAALLSEVS
jgi:hypothetical protein